MGEHRPLTVRETEIVDKWMSAIRRVRSEMAEFYGSFEASMDWNLPSLIKIRDGLDPAISGTTFEDLTSQIREDAFHARDKLRSIDALLAEITDSSI